MKYIAPLNALPGDEENEDRPHWNADPSGTNSALRSGAFPSARGFEACQREIVNVIEESGLEPDDEDWTQLHQAIAAMIAAAVPEMPEELNMTTILQAVYPIGSYYINETDNRNPNTIFGHAVGTWEAIQDKMIMAAGPTYPGATSGGSATLTQTGGQVGPHVHPEDARDFDSGFTYMVGGLATNRSYTRGTVNSGTNSGGAPMNILNPYKTAYIWKRTA